MNVTINGYVSFNCIHCGKAHSVESQSLNFEEDADPNVMEDEEEFIRYVAHINCACKGCGEKIGINFDVWEHPEAVVNYSYYEQAGANNIQCEFDIEYYFDSEAVQQDDINYDQTIAEQPTNNEENANDNEDNNSEFNEDNNSEFNEDENVQERSRKEGYTDHYDSEDY
jgi:hypothetical protein